VYQSVGTLLLEVAAAAAHPDAAKLQAEGVQHLLRDLVKVVPALGSVPAISSSALAPPLYGPLPGAHYRPTSPGYYPVEDATYLKPFLPASVTPSPSAAAEATQSPPLPAAGPAPKPYSDGITNDTDPGSALLWDMAFGNNSAVEVVHVDSTAPAVEPSAGRTDTGPSSASSSNHTAGGNDAPPAPSNSAQPSHSRPESGLAARELVAPSHQRASNSSLPSTRAVPSVLGGRSSSLTGRRAANSTDSPSSGPTQATHADANVRTIKATNNSAAAVVASSAFDILLEGPLVYGITEAKLAHLRSAMAHAATMQVRSSIGWHGGTW
jgi:hypothetical protein